jgi:rod shape determining protein RodA
LRLSQLRRDASTIGGGSGRWLRSPRWREFDWHILAIALVIFAIGLLFIQAISGDEHISGRQKVDFNGHLKKVVVAVPCFLIALYIRPRWLRRNAWLLYGMCLTLVALVPFIGVERNNARRWIDLRFYDLQPSELVKLGVILILARVLQSNRLRSLSDWRLPVALVILPILFIFKQPDLGTAMTLVPITLGMFYLAGARARTITKLVLASVVLGVCAYQFQWIEGYQGERIETWLSSYEAKELIENKHGAAFHAYQARTAIGNGYLFGTGLGEGVATRVRSLPELDSDSVLAVILEEAGLIGGGAMLLAYALFIALIFISASEMRDRFARLVVGGIGLYFAAHLFIHCGVNLGLLPMTGLPLPLVSTGGTSLLMSLTAIGLALGLSSHYERTLDEDSFKRY